MATPFYINLDKDSRLKNPNVTMNLYVPLNANRNAQRTTVHRSYMDIPPNNSVNLLTWMAYISKRTSPISNGSYTDPAAAYTAGLTEGALYYNKTNNRLEVLMGQGAYADDASAATGGVSVGELYYNTTSSSYVTRMA